MKNLRRLSLVASILLGLGRSGPRGGRGRRGIGWRSGSSSNIGGRATSSSRAGRSARRTSRRPGSSARTTTAGGGSWSGRPRPRHDGKTQGDPDSPSRISTWRPTGRSSRTTRSAIGSTRRPSSRSCRRTPRRPSGAGRTSERGSRCSRPRGRRTSRSSPRAREMSPGSSTRSATRRSIRLRVHEQESLHLRPEAGGRGPGRGEEFAGLGVRR